MHDILDEIVQAREADYQRLGPTFGAHVPEHRGRKVFPFLAEPGVILEIKRASPSKGPIAMDLDPVERAAQYVASGARQLSILTEQRYFKGSLDDLVGIGNSGVQAALLRKDFLLHEEEIAVSYRAGADAVLLIARILSLSSLHEMCRTCRTLGMVPFVEIRENEDLGKLASVLAEGPVVAGVNSRDLRTFRIDPLVPAMMRERLRCKAVFESGAQDPRMGTYARSLGYEGLLVGEAVSKNPERAKQFVDTFIGGQPDKAGRFWREIGKRRFAAGSRPLVKICGITNEEDALLAAGYGADLLGFVYAHSPRTADARVIRRCKELLFRHHGAGMPLLVGVVTSLDGPFGHQALELGREGVLDALQLHGHSPGDMMAELDTRCGGADRMGRYAAVGIEVPADLAKEHALLDAGEPRVLCDAKVGGRSGGTGTIINADILNVRTDGSPLWIAGGLGPQEVATVIETYRPELIDASSKLEGRPGKKDQDSVRKFFKEVCR